ncbi:UXX-star selenoprotein family 1 [Desulfovibrio oxyclinae]|uniref:UXX-star selenoprotein family 1 n=1 Tax=Desulfovibrio oxyclinae TaxID=63560 RepID=UPI0003701AAB|nr:UXX-star (seleno)protein family 1 [Desulfovibrio oxyclinae]
MNQDIIIYGKRTCPHTHKALSAHREAIFHDIQLNPEKLDEMLSLNGGVKRIPTIVQDGEVSIGYNRGS